MIRKKNKYLKPRKLYESGRIKEENILKKNYGLKNKREIWKTVAKVTYYRRRAKELAKESLEEQQVLFNKLNALGLKVNTIAEVLDLKVENFLDRRLPTIVLKKKLSPTIKTARQMVTHKRILINGRVVNAPSYIVPISQENHIALKQKQKKPKAEVKETEKVMEVEQNA